MRILYIFLLSLVASFAVGQSDCPIDPYTQINNFEGEVINIIESNINEFKCDMLDTCNIDVTIINNFADSVQAVVDRSMPSGGGFDCSDLDDCDIDFICARLDSCDVLGCAGITSSNSSWSRGGGSGGGLTFITAPIGSSISFVSGGGAIPSGLPIASTTTPTTSITTLFTGGISDEGTYIFEIVTPSGVVCQVTEYFIIEKIPCSNVIINQGAAVNTTDYSMPFVVNYDPCDPANAGQIQTDISSYMQDGECQNAMFYFGDNEDSDCKFWYSDTAGEPPVVFFNSSSTGGGGTGSFSCSDLNGCDWLLLDTTLFTSTVQGIIYSTNIFQLDTTALKPLIEDCISSSSIGTGGNDTNSYILDIVRDEPNEGIYFDGSSAADGEAFDGLIDLKDLIRMESLADVEDYPDSGTNAQYYACYNETTQQVEWFNKAGSGGGSDGNGMFDIINQAQTWAVTTFGLGGNTLTLGNGNNWTLFDLGNYLLSALKIDIISSGNARFGTTSTTGKTFIQTADSNIAGNLITDEVLTNVGGQENQYRNIFLGGTTGFSPAPSIIPTPYSSATPPQDNQWYEHQVRFNTATGLWETRWKLSTD